MLMKCLNKTNLKRCIAIAVISPIVALATTVQAKPLAKSAGLSGTVGINTAVSYNRSQFNTDDDNKSTGSLNNSGDVNVAPAVFPFLGLAYTTQDMQTQYFIGQSKENILDSGLQYEIGFKQRFGDREELTVAYIPDFSVGNETWADPYVTGQDREETEINANGMRIAYKFLPLTFKYVYADIEIDDEKSGQSSTACNGSACSADEIRSLNRDAEFQSYTIEAVLPLVNGAWLTPSVSYIDKNAEGGSQSYTGYDMALRFSTLIGQTFMSIEGGYIKKEYDVINPIFDELQENKRMQVLFVYSYDKPFGWNNTKFNMLYKFYNDNSNIDFYDNHTQLVSMGLSYDF